MTYLKGIEDRCIAKARGSCLHIYLSIDLCMCVLSLLFSLSLSLYVYLSLSIYIYIYIHTYICIHVHICIHYIYIYTHIFLSLSLSIYTYIHVYIYIYIYVYIYIYMSIVALEPQPHSAPRHKTRLVSSILIAASAGRKLSDHQVMREESFRTTKYGGLFGPPPVSVSVLHLSLAPRAHADACADPGS